MRAILVLLLLALLAAGALRYLERTRPQDLPWTPLALEAPVGLATRAKIMALADDPERCAALLEAAPFAAAAVPDRTEAPTCGWRNAFRLSGPSVSPAPVTLSCPAAVAYAIWLNRSADPAAERHLGSPLAQVENFGTYSCRRLYGREVGAFSEHATANAIDIAGFRTRDGRRVTLARDWNGDAQEAAFLREARDGACDLFGTTLSPDYNAAHADHFHLDMADRGGWGVCR